MSNVISLITFYNPSVKNVENAKRIIAQSSSTIIIDNSSFSNERLLRENEVFDKIVYCPNFSNLGLSMAFNKVLKTNDFYEWKDEDFIVFFDQDSVIEDNHIAKLVDEYKAIEKIGVPIGCIGPAYFDLSHGTIRTPRMYKRLSEESMIVNSIMTSSMVCRYKTMTKIGFWSEDVFLDMADWDICWKMKKHGMKTIMTKRVLLTHKVGEGSKKVGLLTLDIAKPFREYYETRDCVYMLRKNYVPLKNRIRFHLQLTLRPLLHLMFLEDKAERKYYIRLGMKHSKKNIYGPLPQTDLWNK